MDITQDGVRDGKLPKQESSNKGCSPKVTQDVRGLVKSSSKSAMLYNNTELFVTRKYFHPKRLILCSPLGPWSSVISVPHSGLVLMRMRKIGPY